MGRYEDYQNLIDAKILQGLQWGTVIEPVYDPDAEKYYIATSYNSLKALKDSNANIMLHGIDINGVDVADIYVPLAVLWAQTSTTPPIYGAYFSGEIQVSYEAEDPDSFLYES